MHPSSLSKVRSTNTFLCCEGHHLKSQRTLQNTMQSTCKLITDSNQGLHLYETFKVIYTFDTPIVLLECNTFMCHVAIQRVPNPATRLHWSPINDGIDFNIHVSPMLYCRFVPFEHPTFVLACGINLMRRSTQTRVPRRSR